MVAVPQWPDIAPSAQEEVLPALPSGWLGRTALAVAADARAAWARTLPLSADDLQRDFGYQFYEQVALDPQVDAAERILITGVFSAGITYTIPVPRAAPEYAQAARLQRFVATVLDRLSRPLDAFLAEMARGARTHGHKLAEAIWTTAPVLGFAGPALVYADLKPKPLGTYWFVQDVYANTLGITPRQPYPYVTGAQVVSTGTVNGLPLYPLTKFPVLTWNEADRDPRGRSALRTIYGAWWKKQQAEPGLLAYLARFGQPSLKMLKAPNTPESLLVDGVDVSTNDLYRQAGTDYQAGGVLVLPMGADALLQEANGDGAAYIKAEQLWNQAILLGLTGQTLATSEGTGHRSGTDSRTHQDMLGLLVTFLKFWVTDFANRLIVAPLITANFGAAALPLAPRVDLGRISPEDLAAMAQAIAQLAGQGYWDPTRVPPDVGAELDTRIGFPQRQIIAVGPTGTPTDTPAPPPTPPPQGEPQHG